VSVHFSSQGGNWCRSIFPVDKWTDNIFPQLMNGLTTLFLSSLFPTYDAQGWEQPQTGAKRVIPGTRSKSVSALAKLVRSCSSIRGSLRVELCFLFLAKPWGRPLFPGSGRWQEPLFEGPRRNNRFCLLYRFYSPIRLHYDRPPARSMVAERKRGRSVNRMKNQRRCCFLRSLGLVSLVRFVLCKTAVELRFGVVHCQLSEERHWVDHAETGELLAESIIAHQMEKLEAAVPYGLEACLRGSRRSPRRLQ
jgi:hypothetical protein